MADEQQPERPARRGQRGTITSRPSRDTILQSYAAQDAERAERMRTHASEAVREYQASASRAADREAQRRELMERQREQDELVKRRRQEEVEGRQRAAQLAAMQQKAAMSDPAARSRIGRDMVSMYDTDEMYARAAEAGRPGHASHPLSSEEGRERSRNAREMHEFERASRDALGGGRYGRRDAREVIDARGSIDSRAFNERDQLVGYSISEEDKPDPLVDASLTQTRWHSRAGQGFDGVPDAGRQHRVPVPAIPRKRGSQPIGGVMGASSIYGRRRVSPKLLVVAGMLVAAAVVALVVVFFR